MKINIQSKKIVHSLIKTIKYKYAILIIYNTQSFYNNTQQPNSIICLSRNELFIYSNMFISGFWNLLKEGYAIYNKTLGATGVGLQNC